MGVGECILVRIEQRFNLSFIIFFVLLCGYFSVEQCFILSFIIIIFYFTVIFWNIHFKLKNVTIALSFCEIVLSFLKIALAEPYNRCLDDP